MNPADNHYEMIDRLLFGRESRNFLSKNLGRFERLFGNASESLKRDMSFKVNILYLSSENQIKNSVQI